MQWDSLPRSFGKEQFMPLVSIQGGHSMAAGNFNSSFVFPELLGPTLEFGIKLFGAWRVFLPTR